jgi:hypothetical protein
MSNIQPPPINEKLSDEQGIASLAWILFFNQLFIGDTGTDWTPTFTGLGTSGTPTITGRYYKISQELCYFRVTITPGTNTTSTAGTTYIDNFPLVISASGIVSVITDDLGAGQGKAVAGNNRIFTPAWTNITVPITITGTIEAR